MNRSRSCVVRPPIARVTRSAKSQAAHPKPTEIQDSEEGLYGKHKKIQMDSTPAADLCHMSVETQDIFITSKASDSSGDPLPACQTSGSKADRGSPSSRGVKSSSPHDLLSVARLVKLGRCKNVVVVAGAGISTASGIPDFRTPGTGLYSNLEKYNVPYPEAIFNIDYFSDNPQPFFSLAKVLYPGSHRPNYIHYFIRMLHHKGLLLRMYTQNIDGLEKLCGIPDDKLVEAHGSFATASCHLCYTPYPAEEARVRPAPYTHRLIDHTCCYSNTPCIRSLLQYAIMHDRVPTCSFCAATVKPDVVFFGEDLPRKYFLHRKDFPKADLLIIMGTSLKIEPFASLINSVRSTVPRLLLNRNAVGPFERIPLRRGDHMELGDLADSVRKFAELLGWDGEIQELMGSQEVESPMLLSSPSSQSRLPFQNGVPSDHESCEETSRAASSRVSSSNEETDSETDSKSSA
uniref:Si:dkey-103i16.6 n=1 Tax=Oryzias melastigma TaxID=30732 RepID=A0A3B3DEQ5_ORYME